MLPRLEFNIGHLTWDTNLFERIKKTKIRNKTELKDYLFKIYPEIKKTKTRKDIRLFILNEYKNNFDEIYGKILYFQEEWDKINDKLLKAISDVIETEWDKNAINAYVSISPINPRELKNYSFSIDYKANYRIFLAICTHELIHFLYFKKLIEIYPKIDTSTFDKGKTWKLSEILAPILMNNPKIVKIIGKSDIGAYVCDEKISKKFWNLYQESLKNKESFEKFYKKCEKII